MDGKQSDVSRRDLLRYTSGGVIAGAIGGSALPAGAAESAPAAESVPGAHGSEAGPTEIRLSRTFRNHRLEADVVVAGGGMAGVCAAIAAARNGASVILIQDRHVLGGNASSEVRMHIVGADWSGSRKGVDARETGIIEELRLDDAAGNLQRSASLWDLLLFDRVRAESNITLLLNTRLTGVEMAGPDRIAAVQALRASTEDTFTIRGRLFLDCTGDGGLGVAAGAEFRVGREGRAEFGESMAPAEPDNRVLGSTLLFVTRDHGRPMPFRPPAWIHRFPTCEDLPHRSHHTWEYGYWWVEWGGEIDTIRDNERIRDELLAAALGVWDHIKNSGKHPQSENWALDWLGFLPGKRENRRFVGDYVLRQDDVQRGETFDDGVALGGWPIDLHPPEGIYSKEKPATAVGVPLYNIPLRCLYSRNIRNLLFAGRNISASHVAFGSTRVMATCSVIGQAAGTAAALCARRNLLPRGLARDAIADLQQVLLKDDAYIIGVSNQDSADLARTAQVRAFSETPAGPAASVINGVHRGVEKNSNRWISDVHVGLPAWIELRFRRPERIREVHLTFDSGLDRPLTLTHSDGFNRRMVRGPQPETVRDYTLSLISGQTQQAVADVKGNHQRKRIHRFEPQTVDGVRLLVQDTNGDHSARLFEIRAYA